MSELIKSLKQDPKFTAFYKEVVEKFGKPIGFKVETIEQCREREKTYNVNIYEDLT